MPRGWRCRNQLRDRFPAGAQRPDLAACARSDRSSTPRSVSVSARPSHQPSLTQPSRRLEDGVEMPLEELLVGPVTSAFGGGDGLSDPRVELLPVAELGAQTRADEEPVLEVHA